MDTLQAFISANAAALEELRAFCAALSDSELLTPMPAGWTPASVLVHCAFWDLRAEALIAKWQAEGVGPAPLDTDIINEATRLPFLAISPREAVRVALAASEAANRAVAALDEALAREILEHGATLQLDRAEHWRMHMEEITAALAARAH